MMCTHNEEQDEQRRQQRRHDQECLVDCTQQCASRSQPGYHGSPSMTIDPKCTPVRRQRVNIWAKFSRNGFAPEFQVRRRIGRDLKRSEPAAITNSDAKIGQRPRNWC
jgi:hypothetical protein